ncbi:hypothetical protein M3E71_11370 [Brevibacterium casei]|uniref:hypothetical protein n=1 Tax=Brevibacterium casei TaxID=33889 RepID=UPI00191ACB5F|nr:hypothetical protein [Brevibacterium casei]MCT1560973.1 hypothetical protein [Brevibacterium casei]QQT68815.1 hypothetical protein I6I57_14070 [Brevibacterium casei]
MIAAAEARQQEQRQAEAQQRQADEQARQAEKARRVEKERRQATPTHSTDEIAAAFADWERRVSRGGSLASQHF